MTKAWAEDCVWSFPGAIATNCVEPKAGRHFTTQTGQKNASLHNHAVKALGASGGVLAIYSHGYDQFSLAQWTQLFSTMHSIGGSCMTMSQASAYVHSHGTLVPDGTSKNWVQTVVLAPNFSRTSLSPPQGAQDFQFVWPLQNAQSGFESQSPLLVTTVVDSGNLNLRWAA